jgi:hypothetical protein
MRWLITLIVSVAMAGCAAAGQSQGSPALTAKGPAPAASALLPDEFAGWKLAGAARKITDAAEADGANAAALKEYDFTDAAVGSYQREGETLSVRALRFSDASGAYGAYSFYRQNNWAKEEIGTGATSDHNRVLFWVGNTVMDATFSRISPMSGSELRELAGQLPAPEGGKALAPPILADLPHGSLDGQTTHYALGAAGYSGAGGVLPPELVGFDRGAEAVTANYTLRSGVATLTVIDYPTPQLAAAEETKIRDYIHAGKQAQPAWPKPLVDSDTASLEVKRSGPLVALVSGDATPEESHKLLAAVHYELDLMSIPQQMESEVAKTGKLLLGIAALVAIGCSAAILLGFFLGGFRALYRIARGRPASSVYDVEFTSLNLQKRWEEDSLGNAGADFRGQREKKPGQKRE